MLFSAVKSILLQNLESIAKARNLNADQVAREVVRHLENMSYQWRCAPKPTIPYEDPLCRLAYLYGCVPAQANLLCNVLIECGWHSESFNQKLTGKKLSLVTFGGGPGTELLGFAKYFHDRVMYEPHEQIEVRIDVIDRVPAWAENVSWIKDQISEFYSKQFGSLREYSDAERETRIEGTPQLGT
jgi:hypothetical protein